MAKKERRKPRNFTEEFKKQMVGLFNTGKSISQIAKEYDLTRSTLQNWINYYNNTGSFKIADNRTEEEKELIKLQKENRQLKMENDILKQAALILGQK